MKELIKIFIFLAVITVAQPASAGNIFKKSEGKAVAKKNAKTSVKNNKRATKGFKKASKEVNRRLSEQAYGKGVGRG